MQVAVSELNRLGPLPSSTGADPVILEEYQSLLAEVKTPVADDDARILVKLFGIDDCFGLAWTLLHLVETAPGWPISDCLCATSNEWVRLLKERAENRGV